MNKIRKQKDQRKTTKETNLGHCKLQEIKLLFLSLIGWLDSANILANHRPRSMKSLEIWDLVLVSINFINSTVLWWVKRSLQCSNLSQIVFDFQDLRVTHSTENLHSLYNSSTPKILLLILPSSCYTSPCKLVIRSWC